jgi:hypothetical protein
VPAATIETMPAISNAANAPQTARHFETLGFIVGLTGSEHTHCAELKSPMLLHTMGADIVESEVLPSMIFGYPGHPAPMGGKVFSPDGSDLGPKQNQNITCSENSKQLSIPQPEFFGTTLQPQALQCLAEAHNASSHLRRL